SGHSRSVTSLAFSPDGNQLVSGSLDKTVILWDVVAGTPLATLDHDGIVTSVDFSPAAGSFASAPAIASGSFDHTLRLWDVPSGEARTTHSLVDSTVSSVAFSPDGTWIAYGLYDNSVHLWNPTTDEDAALTGHTGGVSRVVFSPDSTVLASAGQDSSVRLWDVATQQQTAILSDSNII